MSDPTLPPYDSEMALTVLRRMAHPDTVERVLARRRDQTSVDTRHAWWLGLYRSECWSFRRIARATGYHKATVSRGVRRVDQPDAS